MTGELQSYYANVEREAVALAGGLTALSQRATVYRHLFLASGGDHAFPLIAAHGALWAGGYFRFGMRLGAALSWPLLRSISLKPCVRFAYFPDGTRLWFRNFGSQEERIEKGLAAFSLAARVGWSRVESALQQYQVLPDMFFTTPTEYFADMRAAVLAPN